MSNIILNFMENDYQGIIEIYLKSNPTYNDTMNSDPVIRGMEFWY